MTIFTHFNQSTWLAKRALEAQALGPPRMPAMVALPGMRAAISTERLHAHHDAGHDEHEIAQRANARWAADNVEQLQAHDSWVTRYQGALEEVRRDAARKAAEELRRRAIFEQFVAEHASEE